MRWSLLFSVIQFFAFGGPAFAMSQADFVDCQQMQNIDRGIAGCTKIIEDPSAGVPDRAVAYFDRGVAYYVSNDLDRAIADWSAAVKLVPDYVHAYTDLAKAYRAKGDYANAIDNYSEAIKRDPRHAVAYKGRGIAYLLAGQNAKAQTDFDQAEALDPTDLYILLWRDIARRRNNQPSNIAQASVRVNMGTWPAPLLLLYAGQVNPHEVAVAAQNIDPIVTQARLCDAYFYIGESMLLGGDKDEATDLFQRTLKVCPETFDQYSVAVAELKALGRPLKARGTAEQGTSTKSPQ